jgi:hypothetical protein
VIFFSPLLQKLCLRSRRLPVILRKINRYLIVFTLPLFVLIILVSPYHTVLLFINIVTTHLHLKFPYFVIFFYSISHFIKLIPAALIYWSSLPYSMSHDYSNFILQ